MRSIRLAVLLALFPITCHAYIDPGFLGMVGQFAYLILFGLIGAFILRPYAWIKSLFSRRKPEAAEAPGQPTPAVEKATEATEPDGRQ